MSEEERINQALEVVKGGKKARSRGRMVQNHSVETETRKKNTTTIRVNRHLLKTITFPFIGQSTFPSDGPIGKKHVNRITREYN